MSSGRLLIGFLGRLALLRDGQNNFSALVIILSANNYSYDMEEGATHEKI
jgi:hypothetical protein